ncbi:MAG: cytochrome c3 family protein [Gemmatimonadota bacterium]
MLLLPILLIVAMCVDERIVYRDRELFDDPPAGALGYLGYSDVDEQLTVCGNCHIGKQGGWEETGHASAWHDLQESGSAQGFCEGCHTTNSLGSPVVEGREGGWFAADEERYHDVQCESCHGPGLDHVTNPDATQPLAPLDVDIDLDGDGTVDALACGECHSGAHQPFVEEWVVSPHGQMANSAFPASRVEQCDGCHTGEGALRQWGVRSSYLERDEVLHSGESNLAITCGVCHDPHDATNEHQLRFPVATASADEHLCAQCHDRTTTPNPESSHGLEPHAPETALLVGEAGHFFPGSSIDRGQIIGSHGSEGNDRLCATCHINDFEVESETGEFVMNATGHLFAPVPCVDADGVPLPRGETCEVTADARAFNGCTDCHESQQAAASALLTAADRLERLAAELHDLLLQVDPNLADAGGEIDPTEPTFTTAEGAYFNLELARFGTDITGSGVTTYGAAAHNPFLTENLLIQSIDAVEDAYGVAASADVSLAPQLRPPAP